MDWIPWVYAISALASAIAAILAWAAKLWWAKEYGAAKDEIIRAKEAQIEQLKGEIQSLHDLTPMKIREYFVSVTTQLEEYNDRLKQEIDKARVEIEQKNQAIARYSQDTDLAIDELNKLKA